ncbi:MAG: EVE domain-containing protein [Bacteroidia bacterium]
MNYWLIKSDPETYSWQDLVKDKKTTWDGIRNYQARNNLRLMKKGDKLIVYHSNLGEVVGTAEVTKEAFQDPTSENINWVAVELKASKSLKKPVSLIEIKANKKLQNISLIKHTRLSVMPLKEEEYNEILTMGSH